MKNFICVLLSILLSVLTAATVFASGKNNVVNFKEQGGARWVVGGSLDVATGGDLDIESGGSFKLGGTAITSTAAELNIMDGVTATATELNLIDGYTGTTAELNQLAAASQLADGLLVKGLARATLDCGASSCVAGDVALGVSLPAKALVTQVYFQIITQFVDGGSGTVALKCEDAANLFAAADITGLAIAVTTSGIPIGTAGTMVSAIAATCVLTATIATAEQTAGVLNLFVEYVVHD